MPIARITISVPQKLAERIRKAAGARPVSAWVTDTLEERLDDMELERLWDAFYREVAPTARDVRRADTIFKRLTRRRGRKSAA